MNEQDEMTTHVPESWKLRKPYAPPPKMRRRLRDDSPSLAMPVLITGFIMIFVIGRQMVGSMSGAGGSVAATFIFGLVMIAGATCFYLIPTFLAASRRHRNYEAIMLLNLLGGWTVVGWLAAIVWEIGRAHV